LKGADAAQLHERLEHPGLIGKGAIQSQTLLAQHARTSKVTLKTG
jgi:hypothetical protein